MNLLKYDKKDVDLFFLLLEKKKEGFFFRSDPRFTDCKVTFRDCSYELVSLRRALL